MKVWIAAPLAMLVSANLMAAERVEHQVTVTAQIPTEAFYVQPTGGDNWMSTPQKLAYNPYTKKLDTLSKQLDAKSTIGAITGYLTNPAVMASGNAMEKPMKAMSADRHIIRYAMAQPYLEREEELDLAIRWKENDDQGGLEVAVVGNDGGGTHGIGSVGAKGLRLG